MSSLCVTRTESGMRFVPVIYNTCNGSDLLSGLNFVWTPHSTVGFVLLGLENSNLILAGCFHFESMHH